MQNKKIGILGMSADSNKLLLNHLTAQNEFSNSEIKFFPTHFEEINKLLPHPSVELKQILISYLSKIEAIDYLIVPNITIHETLDELFELHTFPFTLIHPVQLAIKKIQSNNIQSVLLLGSRFTMQAGYISNLLEQNHISCHFPNSHDIQKIDACRIAIYQNKYTQEMKQIFENIISTYTQKHTLLLACTELSIAYISEDSKVFDMLNLKIL